MESVQMEAIKNPESVQQPLADEDSSFLPFKNLSHMYLRAITDGGTGVVVQNANQTEIARCQIPRLEDRAPGQIYAVKDAAGKKLLMARRGLNESINLTSGTGNVWLGRLKAPTFGRTFYFRSALGFSFDILCQTDHQLRLGSIEFNRRNGICEIRLTATESELNLNEKTIALICAAGIILFEWYFRKSELGQHGRRGSICLLSYISFICLLLVTVGTVFIISLHIF